MAWLNMTHFAKSCYLINTYQAKDFKAAAELLRSVRARKQSRSTAQLTTATSRLPYADN